MLIKPEIEIRFGMVVVAVVVVVVTAAVNPSISLLFIFASTLTATFTITNPSSPTTIATVFFSTFTRQTLVADTVPLATEASLIVHICFHDVIDVVTAIISRIWKPMATTGRQ